MEYRGLRRLPADSTGFPRSRGWPVRAGSQDLVAAGQFLQQACGGFARRFLLGVSMGGNASGLAAALKAKTADGRPLFDYWIDVEGVDNLTELYQQASAVAATNPFAAEAKQDIEIETGGTFAQVPQAYAQRTNVERAADIAASGLRGAVLVHAIDDGEATYDQAQQLERALRGDGLRTDLYSVSRKAPGDTPDTTLDGDQTMAGHAPEWSTHHIVLDTGFDRLSALAAGAQPPPCNRDFAVDGRSSPTTTPDPASPASGCPAHPTFAGSGAHPRPGGARCGDFLAPRLSVRVRRTGRHRLRVRGRAKDLGCAGLARVRVAVARRAGRRCRFVLRARTGRLSHRRSCTRHVPFLRPHGRAAFRLTARRLRAGRYRVLARAVDRAGNRRTIARRARFRAARGSR
jgi:hypothetical protein